MYSRLYRIYSGIRVSVEEYMEKLCSGEYTVILFGSRARGDYRGDSDWDILVIGYREPEKPFLPIHIFYYKPGEVINEIKRFNTIVIDAFYEGRLLCDKLSIYTKLRGIVFRELDKRNIVKKKNGWFPRKENR